ncbi:MAG: hypothetical protein R2748_33000 [Bryobacterales bacterium]
MATVQIVIDDDLLRRIDAAASEDEVNRSQFIRSSVERDLRSRQIALMERLEREAYQRIPDDPEEFRVWEEEAMWPDE